MCKSKSNKGFTLVELIVVVIILAILIGITIIGIYKWIGEARKNTDRNNRKAFEDGVSAVMMDMPPIKYNENYYSTKKAQPYVWINISRYQLDGKWQNLFARVFCIADGSSSEWVKDNNGAQDLVAKWYKANVVSANIKGIDSAEGLEVPHSKTGSVFCMMCHFDEDGYFDGCKCVWLNKSAMVLSGSTNGNEYIFKSNNHYGGLCKKYFPDIAVPESYVNQLPSNLIACDGGVYADFNN